MENQYLNYKIKFVENLGQFQNLNDFRGCTVFYTIPKRVQKNRKMTFFLIITFAFNSSGVFSISFLVSFFAFRREIYYICIFYVILFFMNLTILNHYSQEI